MAPEVPPRICQKVGRKRGRGGAAAGIPAAERQDPDPGGRGSGHEPELSCQQAVFATGADNRWQDQGCPYDCE